MKLTPALCCWLALGGLLQAQDVSVEKVKASRCHVYLDFEYIWTFEMVEEAADANVPILNIITFGEEEHPFRPEQIAIYDSGGRPAQVEKFSIDTGVEGDPYVTSFLTVLGGSFIGMDLEGNFSRFGEPQRVAIELGAHEFQLQAVDCLDFEGLAEKIDQVNFNSPNIKEDFEVLGIEPLGKKTARRKGRR